MIRVKICIKVPRASLTEITIIFVYSTSADWGLGWVMAGELQFKLVTTPEIELSDWRKDSQEMRVTFNSKIKADGQPCRWLVL